MRSLVGLAVSTAAIWTATPASAADPEIWVTASGEGSFGGPFTWDAEFIARFGEEQGGLYEVEAGGFIGYELSESVTLSAGYVYVPGYEDGALTRREHRARQEVEAKLGEVAGGELAVRGRLEQRARDDGDDLGWRLRTRIGWSRSLGNAENSPSLRLWHESFFGLNDTDWGQFGGYNRSRSFIGVRIGLTEKLDLEGGYVHQLDIEEEGPDEVAHVLSLALRASF